MNIDGEEARIAEKFWSTIKKYGFAMDEDIIPLMMGGGEGIMKPNIMSKEDLDRVLKSLDSGLSEMEQLRQNLAEDRVHLHESSVKRTQNWKNTKENRRKEQLHARQVRAEEEEKRQSLIDEAWSLVIDQERKQAIDRAKNLMFLASDEGFKDSSKLLAQQVLKERDLQVQLSKKLKKQREEIEKMVENEILARAEMDIQEEAKQRQREKEKRYLHAQEIYLAKQSREEERAKILSEKIWEDQKALMEDAKHREEKSLEKSLRREQTIRFTRDAMDDILNDKRMEEERKQLEEAELMKKVQRFNQDQEYLKGRRREHDRLVADRRDSVLHDRFVEVAEIKDKSQRLRENTLDKISNNHDFNAKFNAHEHFQEEFAKKQEENSGIRERIFQNVAQLCEENTKMRDEAILSMERNYDFCGKMNGYQVQKQKKTYRRHKQ